MASYPGLSGNLPAGINFSKVPSLTVTPGVAQPGLDYMGGQPFTVGSAGGVLGAATSLQGGSTSLNQPAPQPNSSLFTEGLNTIRDTSHQAATQSANQVKSGILDYLDQYKQNQLGLNNQAVQNQLSLQQGRQGVLGMVGQGIRSGGVMLNNRNASDSSATGALADAYSQLGRQQLGGLGNQFAQSQNALGQQQQQLEAGTAQQQRHYDENKISIVNNLVDQVQQRLAYLDSQMASASIPDRVNIEAEKERVRQDALGQLQQYDQLLSQGVAANPQIGADAARLQAASLAQAGTSAANPFTFSSIPPPQLQGTGASLPGGLPIFTFPSRTKQTA